MNIFNYKGYNYLTKNNTLSKTDIQKILDFIIKDVNKEAVQIPGDVIEKQKKDIKDKAEKFEIIKTELTKKHIPITLLRGKKDKYTDISYRDKKVNFKLHDLFKCNRDYTNLIKTYLKGTDEIKCKLNMSGFTKALWDLKSIDNGLVTFSFNRNISSTMQLQAYQIKIIDNNLYIYYLEKPYIFEIVDNKFIEYLKNKTTKHIMGARGTIKKLASSVKTSIKNTDDKIKQAYNDLKSQNFSDCQFEILGEWLWVTTLNEQVKNYLLEHGFKFSLQHLKFYLHNGEYKKRGSKVLSYDKIKELYGGTI